MKRREFLAASCLTAVGALGGKATADYQPADSKQQYLELRCYQMASEECQKAFDDFLAKAAIPAMNRLGIKPVGAFKMAKDEDCNLYVLMPHNSLESVITSNTKMLADAQFQQAGSLILNCPKDKPAYERFESSVLLAFEQCPKVEIPSTKAGRIFQLRIYESHNPIMAKRKIEMFNERGEISLFRRVGLAPVFFGESIIGSKMPNLTYMVGFDDGNSQKTAWDTFSNHPEWKKLSSDPYFKDSVSKVTNLVLRPAASSQI